MEAYEVVQLIQKYQHDLMNELQIVSGYLKMDRKEEVQNKIEHMMKSYQDERKLLNIEAPNLILWVMQFDQQEDNMRLSYEVSDMPMNLKELDQLIVKQLDRIIQKVKRICNPLELYQLELKLLKQSMEADVEIKLSIHGQLSDFSEIENRSINLKETDQLKVEKDKDRCLFTWSYNAK